MGSPPKHERLSRAFDRLARPGTTSWLILAGVMLVAFVVRVDQALSLPTPQLLCDEFIYAGLASGFAEEGRLLFRGEPLHLSFLYPVLIAPAWLADRMETTYELAKTINVALMTASAVPRLPAGSPGRHPGVGTARARPHPAAADDAAQRSAHDRERLPAGIPARPLRDRARAGAPHMGTPGVRAAHLGLATAVRVQGLVLVAVLGTAIVLAVVFELTADAPQRSAPVLLAEACGRSGPRPP